MTELDQDPRSDAPRPPGLPRWVKVSGVVGIAIIVLLVVLLVTGGPGEHGPGRHTGGSDDAPAVEGDHRPPADTPEGHVPPEGAHP